MIAYDRSGVFSDLTAISSKSFAFDVGSGSDRFLIVGIECGPNTGVADIVTSVTYAGVALTKQTSHQCATTGQWIGIWTLKNPTSGSNNLTVNASANWGISGGLFVAPSVYTGVSGSTPLIDIATAQDTVSGGSITLSVTPSGDNAWLFSVARSADVGVQTAGTGTTERQDNGGVAIGDSNTAYTPSGVSRSMQWSTSGSKLAGVMIAFAAGSPGVSTSAVSNIDLTTAVGNGEVTADNGQVITARGIVYGLVTAPTLSDNVVTVAGTLGVYTANMTGLSVNTHYYVRAYATNSIGTSYGEEVEFTTANITDANLVKDINATEGEVWAISMNVGGTTGTLTVSLGNTGASAVFTAGGGVQVMQGAYSGTGGLIIAHSVGFDGTVDDVQWVRVEGTGTIDWALDTFVTIFPIESEVFFKRIEDDVFNTYRLYRYLDLLFKDLDGYVTVTVKSEAHDAVTLKESTFVVGNTSTPASPFSKKRISFLCKDQAIIIGLSNASLNETFAIAKFLLSGHKRPRKMLGADTIISVGD